MKLIKFLLSAILCSFTGCQTASILSEHGPGYNGQKNYFIAPGLTIHKDSYRSSQLVAEADAAMKKAGFVPHTAEMEGLPLMVLVDYIMTDPITTSGTYSYPIYGQTSSGGVSTTSSTATATASGPAGNVYGQGSGFSTTYTQPTYGTVGVGTRSYSHTYFPQAVKIEAFRKLGEKNFSPAWRTFTFSSTRNFDPKNTAARLIRASTSYLGKNLPKEKQVSY